jgi:hypothetical protein
VESMARHNLAARSLRHLRYAHRMMVSQPLLARASHTSHPPTSIVLDGYQLPLGRILRHLPLNDAVWAADGADSAADTAPFPEVAAPVETLLRLLPRLPETHDADATSDTPEDDVGDVGAPPATTSLSGQTHARHVADDALLTPTTPPAVPQARADGLRPRSRIVELPGTVSLPVEEPIAEEPITPDIPEESPEDIPANARAKSLADAHETTESEPEQQPLINESGELITTSKPEPAKTAVEQVTPASPDERVTTPRRRSKQPSATPPRASDALFPPTDADRSPAAWLARLQHAEEPALPTPPEPPDAPVKPGNEPPSEPAQRPGARGSRKGAIKAQVSTTAAPDTSTSSATTPPPEHPQSEEEPTTLPGSSRTLLHTLTGVDPATVRVYRGPVAERVTSAQNADALTDGGAVVLGAGHTTDTPETLGLLAHELTHVARRRSPRFVPPIAQTPRQSHRANVGISAPVSQTVQLAASSADEETQAIQVEARVTRAARGTTAPPHAMQPALPVESEAEALPARETPMRPDMRPVWGNLPAPWEPLPDWMATPAESSIGGPQPASQPQSSSAPARTPSSNTPGTQRAERGRSLPAEVEESSPTHAREIAAPEPDLDQLAQQVHAILKRRLAAERRRFG